MTANLRYPDRKIATDLSWGVPLMGSVPEAGVFSKRLRIPAIPFDQWKEGMEQRNRDMAIRVTSLTNSAMARLCWGETSGEVGRGRLTKPTPVTEAAIRPTPPIPPFCDTGREGGIRVIGDFMESNVNDILGLADTSIPQNLDVLLGMTLAHATGGPGPTVEVFY